MIKDKKGTKQIVHGIGLVIVMFCIIMKFSKVEAFYPYYFPTLIVGGVFLIGAMFIKVDKVAKDEDLSDIEE